MTMVIGLGAVHALDKALAVDLEAAVDQSAVQRGWARVWLPMAMSLPCIGLLSGSGDRLTAGVALTVSGPGLGALLVSGAALWGLTRQPARLPEGGVPPVPMCWPVLGVVLMALAMAGEAPQFLLLVALCVGLVCLSLAAAGRTVSGGQDGRAWLLLGLAALAAAGFLPPGGGPGWVSVAIAGAGVAWIGRRLGPIEAVVAGGWTAFVGGLVGVGTLGLQGLAVSVRSAAGPLPRVGYQPVATLEWLAIPGIVVLLHAAILCGLVRWPRAWTGAAGAVSVAVGVGTVIVLLV